jgi:hypothetical protein
MRRTGAAPDARRNSSWPEGNVERTKPTDAETTARTVDRKGIDEELKHQMFG